MAKLALSWTLPDSGWTECTVADEHAQVQVVASHITDGPRDFLTATTRLVLGERETRAQFEAEPIAYRWIFRIDGHHVQTRLLELPDGKGHDTSGTVIWSSGQALGSLARAVIRSFDDLAYRHGEIGYQDLWGEPFPRRELEILRSAWRRRTVRNPQ